MASSFFGAVFAVIAQVIVIDGGGLFGRLGGKLLIPVHSVATMQGAIEESSFSSVPIVLL